jgi:hypothetical protein
VTRYTLRACPRRHLGSGTDASPVRHPGLDVILARYNRPKAGYQQAKAVTSPVARNSLPLCLNRYDLRMAREGIEPPTRGFSVLQSEEYGTRPDCPGVVVAALTQQCVVPSSLQLSGVWTQVWSQVAPLNSRRPRPWNRPGHEGATLCCWRMRVGVPRSKNKNSGVSEMLSPPGSWGGGMRWFVPAARP